MPLRLGEAPVHINGVSHRLKGVEGDTHRQQHIEVKAVVEFSAHVLQQGFDLRAKEIEVLEGEQQAQIGRYAEPEESPFARFVFRFGNLDGRDVVNDGGTDNQEDVPRIPKHVEVVTRHQQPAPAVAHRRKEIHQRYQWKEHEVVDGVEEHGLLCFSFLMLLVEVNS